MPLSPENRNFFNEKQESEMIRSVLFYCIIFLTIFLQSCKEEVDYDDMNLKNIIVVNGRFIDGETPWCQVSRSDLVFDQTHNKVTPTVFLSDANVTASCEGNTFKYIVVGDSAQMQAEGLKATAGATYTLKASANGLDDVYSTVTIPAKTECDFKFAYHGDSYASNFFELSINDDPNTEDYYQIVLFGKYTHLKYEYLPIEMHGGWINGEWKDYTYEIYDWVLVDSSTVYGDVSNRLYSSDPIMNWNKSRNDPFSYEEENVTHIFNDKLFNGQNIKIKINITLTNEGYQKENINIWNGDIDSLSVEIRHINKEMYMYHRTYQKVQNNDLTGSLSPYMLYCNVEGGAGLVAAWSSTKKRLEVPKEILK